jgi:hydrogenase expression/formation protein HypC
MCLGIPGQVITLTDETTGAATVLVSGVPRQVNLSMVLPDGIAPGDWVLVHAGFALDKISEEEAQETLALQQEVSNAFLQGRFGTTGSINEQVP